MATPPRLVKIECPSCSRPHWEIDSDFRRIGGEGEADPWYDQRVYSCPACGMEGDGWSLQSASPPEFLLQPHDLYPMSRADFDRWVEVLRDNFPNHPRLKGLNKRFYPRTPEEAHARAPHVAEMRGTEMLIRVHPESGFVRMWLDLEGREEVMRFLSKDGDELKVVGPVGGPFRVVYTDSQGRAVLEAGSHPREAALEIISEYLDGIGPQ